METAPYPRYRTLVAGLAGTGVVQEPPAALPAVIGVPIACAPPMR
jgi:hypothetical protein